MSIPFSVLDLSPIVEGGTAADALKNTLDLARHVEQLGYQRYWVAEHHNMPGIASAATVVVMGHVAAGTRTIRVGSGGIMCRITRRWWWRSSLVLSSRCFRGVLIGSRTCSGY